MKIVFFSAPTTQESSSPSGGECGKGTTGFFCCVYYLNLILIRIIDEGSAVKVT